MDPTPTPTAAPPPSTIVFARGVIARLALWSTLRIAVQENWGGPSSAQKRTWLAGVLVDQFEENQNPPPDAEYVEELLLQVLADEFGADEEDGSALSVGRDVVRMWEETRAGRGEVMVARFEEMAEGVRGKRADAREKVASDDEDEDWESDEEEEEEEEDGDEAPQLIERAAPRAPPKEPEVDEDGFTMVKGKGRR